MTRCCYKKLAIQAAGESSRHISLQSLLSIQKQLCEASISETVQPTDIADMNPRMSRIITKLFARVVKAEESLTNAYFRNGVDVESIFLSFTTVFLMKSTDLQYEHYVPCQNMVRVLVLSILKAAKLQNDIPRLNEIVDNLPTESEKIAIFELMKTCSAELGIDLSYRKTSYHIIENTGDMNHDKIILPQLVSKVGGAENDSERRQAVEKLRAHVSNFGYNDLLSHLDTVSSTFKDYILDQLKANDSRTSVSDQGNNTNGTIENSKEITMSEKLRYLKSKLHATEAVVHSAFNANSDESNILNSTGNVESTKSTSRYQSSAIKRESSNDKTISSIREKLANAHQQRALRLAESSQSLGKETSAYAMRPVDAHCTEETKTSDNDTNKIIESDHHVSSSSTSSDYQSTSLLPDRHQSSNKVPSSPSVLGSAATLRARLQEVKRNKYRN